VCGIAAVFGFAGKPVDQSVIERMTESLVHRGPDDCGTFFEGAVGLGFRRLAILDLSPTGHQPMISDDGRFVLIFNGEIYNYVELRKELIEAGYQFRSTGDGEVLLNAYLPRISTNLSPTSWQVARSRNVEFTMSGTLPEISIAIAGERSTCIMTSSTWLNLKSLLNSSLAML
jgi:glutamine phosphoribosylpyrophosphate amidotransferase